MSAGRRTHTAALVWVLPHDAWEPIQAIRSRHDSHLERWPMPHVTLLYPFRSWERLQEIGPTIESALAAVPPFEVTLRRFASFPHRRPTVFLVPEPEEAFRRVHEALRRVFPDCDDLDRFENAFTPHLSVGQCPSPADLPGFLDSLGASFGAIRTRSDAVTLLRRGPDTNDVMVAQARYPLGG
jgi:poly(A) polymerase